MFSQEGTRNQSINLTLEPHTHVYIAASMMIKEQLQNKLEIYRSRLKRSLLSKEVKLASGRSVGTLSKQRL